MERHIRRDSKCNKYETLR